MAAKIVQMPKPGEIKAGHTRIEQLREELRSWSFEHRQAIGQLVLAEKEQKAVEDALEKGDIDAAKRANSAARQSLMRARLRREKAKGLTLGLDSILGSMSGWLQGVGL